LGFPLRVVVGRGAAKGVVEVSERRARAEVRELDASGVAAWARAGH
jgi:hypothetical protein